MLLATLLVASMLVLPGNVALGAEGGTGPAGRAVAHGRVDATDKRPTGVVHVQL